MMEDLRVYSKEELIVKIVGLERALDSAIEEVKALKEERRALISELNDPTPYVEHY